MDSVSCSDPQLSCCLLLTLLMCALYLLLFLLIFQIVRPGMVAKVIAYGVSQWHPIVSHPTHRCWLSLVVGVSHPTHCCWLSLGLTKIVRSLLWHWVSSSFLEPAYWASNPDSILNDVYEQVTFLSVPQFSHL